MPLPRSCIFGLILRLLRQRYQTHLVWYSPHKSHWLHRRVCSNHSSWWSWHPFLFCTAPLAHAHILAADTGPPSQDWYTDSSVSAFEMLRFTAEVFPDRQLSTESETLPSRVSRRNIKVSAGSYTTCSLNWSLWYKQYSVFLIPNRKRLQWTRC